MKIVIGGKPEGGEIDQKVATVDVWWVREFQTWAVSMYNKDRDNIPFPDSGEECEYHHHKSDARDSGAILAGVHNAQLRVFTKKGGF